MTRPTGRAAGHQRTATRVLEGATRAVAAVLADGVSADAALAGQLPGPTRAAVQAVTLGTLRWYLRLSPAVLALLAQPTMRTDVRLRALLTCAAHQLEYSTHPAATTVAAAVDAARLLGLAHAAGLVNAVLRRYLRERVARLARVDSTLATRSAHPAWFVASLAQAWPEQCEAVLAANNQHPPLCLRVDTSRVALAQYLQELAAQGIEAAVVPGIDTAVTLAAPVAVETLPGFADGRVSVQDSSAQLAAPLLAPLNGERVLDACAAPGGKSGALLEAAGGAIALTAVDADALRLGRVADNLLRLKRSARLVHADLRQAPTWWDGLPFDAILLDAPCSGTGVIRRHPDIKLLRRAGDLAQFAALQLELLQACWPLLRAGGRLLYATCSVLPAENVEVVGAWLARTDGAHERPLAAAAERWPALRRCAHGAQILPGAGGDGFYYACLTK